MKSKLTVPKRNPFVCLVLKKTGAGSHRKPNKAMRRQEKQSGYNSIGQSSRLLPDLSEFKSLCPDHVTILKRIQVDRSTQNLTRFCQSTFQYGDVVQLEEQVLHTDKVGGSNPSFTTNNGQVAERPIASVLKTEGRKRSVSSNLTLPSNSKADLVKVVLTPV